MKGDYPPQHIIEEQLASWCHPLLVMSFNYYIWIMKLNNIMQIMLVGQRKKLYENLMTCNGGKYNTKN